MRLKALGTSGGVGGGRHTSSILVNDNVLIDAGTGVGTLSVADMVKIDHVFLTHAHMDHIALLPILIDMCKGMRNGPLAVHALPETIAALREHIFNWSIWPDFTLLPTPDKPALRFSPFLLGDTVRVYGLAVTALPANHPVPAVGFSLNGGSGNVFISGDTTACEAFWTIVAGTRDVRCVIVELAYHNAHAALARKAGHLCPDMLAKHLEKQSRPLDIYVLHLKFGDAEQIEQEMVHLGDIHTIRVLREGDVLTF